MFLLGNKSDERKEERETDMFCLGSVFGWGRIVIQSESIELTRRTKSREKGREYYKDSNIQNHCAVLYKCIFCNERDKVGVSGEREKERKQK